MTRSLAAVAGVALVAVVLAAPVPKVQKNQWLISMDGDLYLFTEGDKEPKKLTDGEGRYSYPTWSPDGKRIAFCSTKDGYSQICTMDADGKKITQLTHTERDSYGPSWSHNGKTIAFYRSIENGNGAEEICTVNAADGKDLWVLSNVDGWNPQYSPDGMFIAFASVRGSDGQMIYTMDTDGKDAKKLVRYNQLGEVSHAWSPDGKWLAFGQCNGDSQIYVIQPDGDGLKAITSFDKDLVPAVAGPSWSPDGTRISFVRYDLPDGEDGEIQRSLWVIDVDGKNQKELLRVDQKFNLLSARWRPR